MTTIKVKNVYTNDIQFVCFVSGLGDVPIILRALQSIAPDHLQYFTEGLESVFSKYGAFLLKNETSLDDLFEDDRTHGRAAYIPSVPDFCWSKFQKDNRERDKRIR